MYDITGACLQMPFDGVEAGNCNGNTSKTDKTSLNGCIKLEQQLVCTLHNQGIARGEQLFHPHPSTATGIQCNACRELISLPHVSLLIALLLLQGALERKREIIHNALHRGSSYTLSHSCCCFFRHIPRHACRDSQRHMQQHRSKALRK